MIDRIKDYIGLNLTINTTEQCSLRCKYCYEFNKKDGVIEFETVKRFIDLMLEDPDPIGVAEDSSSEDSFNKDFLSRNRAFMNNIVIDFIGGDSFANPEIIDKSLSYFQFKMRLLHHKSRNSWRANISTNGTYFREKRIRDLINKWYKVFSVGISIDGNPALHDLNRVFPDETGSMKVILEWWPWIQKYIPVAALVTKSTLAKESIPYIYDSLVFMHEVLGMKFISQNFIMEENGCNDDDYALFDEQMEKCVDYVLENRNNMYWSMLDFNAVASSHGGGGTQFESMGRCGSGSMPCLAINGDVYTCFRWLPVSQKNSKEKKMCLGNVYDGYLNKSVFDIVRKGSVRANCTKEQKCLECDVESGCSYCIAGCYSENGDFIRTTHICEIFKRQVKWARCYWDKYFEIECKEKIDWSTISSATTKTEEEIMKTLKEAENMDYNNRVDYYNKINEIAKKLIK